MHQPSQDSWTEWDRRHVWHPYTQMRTAPPPIPIVKAEGVWLHTADGRKILDGISSWWVNLHGHGHPRLNRAIASQAEKMAQVIFAGATHEPAATLAARLVERAPGSLPRVFFSDDGSTAVEVALKMAYQYWRNRGEPRRTLFVALEHAYHGDTFGAMAAGGVSTFHEAFRDLLFEVRRVQAPACHRCPLGLRREHCAIECSNSLSRLLEKEGDRVAAVIAEPMLQGAGGMIIWPAEYLRRLGRLTHAHGVLFIADEVLTGFGRTGRLFACEHGPVAPDILCLSKGLTGGYLPLAATLATERVYEAFLSEDRTRALLHGHSYTANALACAVALESLTLMDEERSLERVARLERLFRERIERLRRLPAVLDARGIGAVAALDVRPSGGGGYMDSLGPRLSAEFLGRGIFLRPLGNVLYFLPPYAITDDEAHWVFDAIEDVLAGLTD
jgi:adenosylmethionine-8-amino-7-oxononanoate aminotransferase